MPGDSHETYHEFFTTEYGRVVSFLCKAGFAVQIADDATAEAMTSAYTAWHTIINPHRWVRTVAYHNACKSATSSRTELPRLLSKGYGPSTNDGTDMYRYLEQRDELLSVLRRLPDKQRLVMAWHLDGFSDNEIAHAIGMNTATVRSNLRHARATIKMILTGSDVKKAHG